MSWYLDSSAILKLIISERESRPLTEFLNVDAKTSTISRVEVIRALHRVSPEKISDGLRILSKIEMCPAGTPVLSSAENFSSRVTLRTLDAIHVATVLFLGNSVEGLISYDKQMIRNAKEFGIKVLSPGMK